MLQAEGSASLDEDACIGGVVLLAQAEGGVDKYGKDGVHGADVVQHVAVPQHDAHNGHQEVQPPHHLDEPVQPQHQTTSVPLDPQSCRDTRRMHAHS